MNTGINNDSIEVIPFEDTINLEDQMDEHPLLKTPVKRKNKFRDYDNSLNSGNKWEKWRTSDQKSLKSSISCEVLSEIRGEESNLKLSPFSKYLSKLSPLFSKDSLGYKRQKIGSCSKFSVEHMKSPRIERIYAKNDDEII
jgi:hypothetical protein